MKNLARRTVASLLVVAVFALGFGVYLVEYFVDGGDWAAFQVNGHVYADGVLATGSIIDRGGLPLAYVSGGRRSFSDDYATRVATLHVVGDAEGNIGTGLLSAYDTQLMGYNIFGGVYSITGQGNTLRATIDAGVCRAALKALGGMNGAAVVYNYISGDVICMVSAPGFDPESPPELSEDESGTEYDGAYINRNVSSTFTPGSIFKVITLAAAIEKLPELWDMEFECGGQTEVAGEIIKCTENHGRMNINDAFARSCNVAFAELSIKLGGETIRDYAQKAGWLDSFKMSGIPVAAGSYETAPDGTADLAWSGIGQYKDLVNPLAAARLMGAIANGGVAVDPRIVSQITTPLGLPAGIYGSGAAHRLFSAETANTLKEMLRYNVASYYGEERFPGLALGAKSGTAEVTEGSAPHAWFIGFLDDTEIPCAFAVFVEHGGWGVSVAGAAANEILQQAVRMD
jgi:peptidoglycan glycosyltransferase